MALLPLALSRTSVSLAHLSAKLVPIWTLGLLPLFGLGHCRRWLFWADSDCGDHGTVLDADVHLGLENEGYAASGWDVASAWLPSSEAMQEGADAERHADG